MIRLKVVAIIQARMGSARLPGKVLKKVLDKPLLQYLIERVRQSNLIDNIVVATTTSDVDEPIVELCKKMSIPYYRGSETDVLSRYYEAAMQIKADVIVRLTSDCPILDPKVMDTVIAFFLSNHHSYHYVSNTLQRSFPRGMDTEVLSLAALKEANQAAKSNSEREHVTAYIVNHPDKYKTANILYKENQSQHRWTVDTAEDYLLIRKIIETLHVKDPQFSLEDALALLDKFPEWKLINSHIEQKKT